MQNDSTDVEAENSIIVVNVIDVYIVSSQESWCFCVFPPRIFTADYYAFVCVPGMSVRGSTAWRLDGSPLSLLLCITISTFRLTLWHSDKLYFPTFLWIFSFSNLCKPQFLGFFCHFWRRTCCFAVLVCGYGSAQNQSAVCRFIWGLFTFFKRRCVLTFLSGWKKNASFQLFILNDANALLLFMCQSSFSLLVVISTCFQHFIPHGF